MQSHFARSEYRGTLWEVEGREGPSGRVGRDPLGGCTMCTFDETEDPGLVPAIRAPICKMHPMLQYVQLVWKQTFIIDHHLPCQRCHHLISHQNSGRRDDNYNDKNINAHRHGLQSQGLKPKWKILILIYQRKLNQNLNLSERKLNLSWEASGAVEAASELKDLTQSQLLIKEANSLEQNKCNPSSTFPQLTSAGKGSSS